MDSLFSKITRIILLCWDKLTSLIKARELVIKSINFLPDELTFDIGESHQKIVSYQLTLQQLLTAPALFNRLNAQSQTIVLCLRDRQKLLHDIADSRESLYR